MVRKSLAVFCFCLLFFNGPRGLTQESCVDFRGNYRNSEGAILAMAQSTATGSKTPRLTANLSNRPLWNEHLPVNHLELDATSRAYAIPERNVRGRYAAECRSDRVILTIDQDAARNPPAARFTFEIMATEKGLFVFRHLDQSGGGVTFPVLVFERLP